MIQYKCPKCGSPLFQLTYTTMPPIYKYLCPKCGWKHEEMEIIIEEPYDELRDK